MGKLPVYNNLNEKVKYFSNLTIDTIQKFDLWYNEFVKDYKEEDCNIIFRGVNEAKRKLYNSAQRYYIENDLAK